MMILKYLEIHHGLPQEMQAVENLWVDLERVMHARRPKKIAELEACCKEE